MHKSSQKSKTSSRDCPEDMGFDQSERSISGWTNQIAPLHILQEWLRPWSLTFVLNHATFIVFPYMVSKNLTENTNSAESYGEDCSKRVMVKWNTQLLILSCMAGFLKKNDNCDVQSYYLKTSLTVFTISASAFVSLFELIL